MILTAAAMVMAGVFALAAVFTAGESERLHGSGRFERAAIWEAGYSPVDLHRLAGMAALARVDLGAGTVEVVMTHVDGSGDGVVVTGSRLPRGRIGSRVAVSREAEPLLGLTAPIVSRGTVVGVVTATVVSGDRQFGTWHRLRLESLAADAGRHLGRRAAVASTQRDAG